jgi:hypothetical protein
VSTFPPPPTYAAPMLEDPRTKEGYFNPIWIKWFLDFAQLLEETATGSGFAAGINDFLADPSSANLATAMTDESGTGALFFAGGNIGGATGTSLAVTGALTSSGGGIGYAPGAGGTVVQITDKTTGVTLDKLSGTITMNASAIGSQITQSFIFTNSFIDADDYVQIQHTSGGTLGAYNFAVLPAAGSAQVSVRNVHTAGLSEAIVLRFVVIKATTA